MERVRQALDQLSAIQHEAAAYISQLVTANGKGGVEYPAERGGATGRLIGVIRNQTRVQYALIQAGTVGLWYNYGKSTAHIICIDGALTIEIRGKGYVEMTEGDLATIVPGDKLRVITSNQPAEIIVVTVPAAEGYPDE